MINRVLRRCLPSLSLCVLAGPAAAEQVRAGIGDYSTKYRELCVDCHGERMEGTGQGVPLVGVNLRRGDSLAEIEASIANGAPDMGMPAWSKTLDAQTIHNLALYVAETRAGLAYKSFEYDAKFVVPQEPIKTELHTFRLETVIGGLDPLPYSIAPLPDGGILLTEKKRGLSIVSTDGKKSPYIEGAPQAYDDSYILEMQQEFGNGWLLDVALHPDYAKNGWIYLHYGDRCSDCNEVSRQNRRPVSMNTLVRGRIRDGQWVDQQVIWLSDHRFYGLNPDLGAGGRIAFDGKGHVFVSVGVKGSDIYTGIQDLGYPWGKTHRLYDDGRVPADNPFASKPGALPTIWTYGHRSPQGLEWRPATGELWGTEMGPRGGDEINRLLPGRNYGWPLTSKGVNYDGTPVDYGPQLGIQWKPEDIEQPVVDLTPSPAVSSFIFYDGQAFPQWRGNLIVGSLKAQSLYRMVFDGNRLVHQETLIRGLARFRDIAVGPDGSILVLMENNAGGSILRLVPAN